MSSPDPLMKNLKCVLAQHISLACPFENLSKDKLEMLVDQIDGVKIARTTNKSVLTSLTDIKCRYERQICRLGGLDRCDIGKIMSIVHGTPHKTLGFNYPYEKMAEYLDRLFSH